MLKNILPLKILLWLTNPSNNFNIPTDRQTNWREWSRGAAGRGPDWYSHRFIRIGAWLRKKSLVPLKSRKCVRSRKQISVFNWNPHSILFHSTSALPQFIYCRQECVSMRLKNNWIYCCEIYWFGGQSVVDVAFELTGHCIEPNNDWLTKLATTSVDNSCSTILLLLSSLESSQVELSLCGRTRINKSLTTRFSQQLRLIAKTCELFISTIFHFPDSSISTC